MDLTMAIDFGAPIDGHNLSLALLCDGPGIDMIWCGHVFIISGAMILYMHTLQNPPHTPKQIKKCFSIGRK